MTALVAEHGLELEGEADEGDLEALAEAVLTASYRKGIDLYTIDELGEALTEAVLKMSEQYPQNRVRLKAIGGGGVYRIYFSLLNTAAFQVPQNRPRVYIDGISKDKQKSRFRFPPPMRLRLAWTSVRSGAAPCRVKSSCAHMRKKANN